MIDKHLEFQSQLIQFCHKETNVLLCEEALHLYTKTLQVFITKLNSNGLIIIDKFLTVILYPEKTEKMEKKKILYIFLTVALV